MFMLRSAQKGELDRVMLTFRRPPVIIIAPIDLFKTNWNYFCRKISEDEVPKTSFRPCGNKTHLY